MVSSLANGCWNCGASLGCSAAGKARAGAGRRFSSAASLLNGAGPLTQQAIWTQ